MSDTQQQTKTTPAIENLLDKAHTQSFSYYCHQPAFKMHTMAQHLMPETMARSEYTITREVTKIRRNPPLVSVCPDSYGEGLQDAAAFKNKTSSSCFSRPLGLRRNANRPVTPPPIEGKNKDPTSFWVGLDWSVLAEKQQATERRSLKKQAFALNDSKRRRNSTSFRQQPEASNSNSVTKLQAFQQCRNEAHVMLAQFDLQSSMTHAVEGPRVKECKH
jgi:hypothetical protein